MEEPYIPTETKKPFYHRRPARAFSNNKLVGVNTKLKLELAKLEILQSLPPLSERQARNQSADLGKGATTLPYAVLAQSFDTHPQMPKDGPLLEIKETKQIKGQIQLL